MQQQIKPTRMELLNTRKRIGLAKKGHKLLKEKRDALFNEFFTVLNSARESRKKLNELSGNAFEDLSVCEAYLGVVKTGEFAETSSSNSAIELEFDKKNIMGVKIPIVKSSGNKRNLAERGYSIIESSAVLDDAADAFEKILEKIIELSEKETTLAKLAHEIEKTKRKVNSLEYNVIPELNRRKKYISFRLEEMERDKFFVLKKVKKKLSN